MDLEQELQRFNSLTEEDAKAILSKAEGQEADFRSCWYCNGAHEHLKEREVLRCFACGMIYLSGYPVPVVQRRSHGLALTMEDMQKFEEILKWAR